MRRLVREVRLGFAATVSPDGKPNLSPKGTTLVYDDDQLVFADIRSPGTVANLRQNPAIEVNVVDVGTRRGYRFKGVARIVEAGEELQELLRWYAEQGFELEGRADRFVLVRVEHAEELTSPAYDWGSTQEELVGFYARHYAGVWARSLPGDARPAEIHELHYLADDDPYHGSGHSGDGQSWEAVRRPIADAVHRAGTFLDVGCANGLLMESVVRWAPFPVEPYGLDYAPRLVAEARRRLPRWADRIFLGDARTWVPPQDFDFVRTELVYVPEEGRREYVERLLGFVAPGGRLIVCGYGGDEVIAPLRSWGFEPELEREWLSPRSGQRVQLAAIGVPA
jgi:predicted pyridoxine 5'-phosphate oxidase superfamily flavin-nucleotide-binding protein